MVEIHEHKGEGYRPLVDYESWRVAILRYDESATKVTKLERHLETDEVFVLLEGECTLVTEESNGLREWKMEIGKIYNVLKGVWHSTLLSVDSNVLIVENRDTSTKNTEYKKV